MKLLIAVDMEGISGVTHWDHVTPTHPEYQRFRRIMTQDVNAAIAGAAAGGADEIIVSDGHWDGTNILLEELDSRAHLNSGGPSYLSMVQSADSGIHAAMFVGYHARIGAQNAILDHTWSSVRVCNLWLNGKLVGESGLNGAVIGHYNAPVIMISGDQTACAEAADWLPGIEPVIVKQAKGRNAAECLSIKRSQALIHAGAERAVKRFNEGRGPAPLKVTTPVEMIVEFMYSDMADRADLLPGSTRLDGRRVQFSAPDMVAAFRAFRAAVMLANR